MDFIENYVYKAIKRQTCVRQGIHFTLVSGEGTRKKKMCIQSEFSTEWHVGTVSLRDRQSVSQSLP